MMMLMCECERVCMCDILNIPCVCVLNEYDFVPRWSIINLNGLLSSLLLLLFWLFIIHARRRIRDALYLSVVFLFVYSQRRTCATHIIIMKHLYFVGPNTFHRIVIARVSSLCMVHCYCMLFSSLKFWTKQQQKNTPWEVAVVFLLCVSAAAMNCGFVLLQTHMYEVQTK